MRMNCLSVGRFYDDPAPMTQKLAAASQIFCSSENLQDFQQPSARSINEMNTGGDRATVATYLDLYTNDGCIFSQLAAASSLQYRCWQYQNLIRSWKDKFVNHKTFLHGASTLDTKQPQETVWHGRRLGLDQGSLMGIWELIALSFLPSHIFKMKNVWLSSELATFWPSS